MSLYGVSLPSSVGRPEQVTSQQMYVDRVTFMDIYDIFIYLLQVGFHQVAVVGRLVQK